MTTELSARLRDYPGRETILEAADAHDANARKLTGAREETAHHIRLNAALRLNNADLQGHANILTARIAELERALPKLEAIAMAARKIPIGACEEGPVTAVLSENFEELCDALLSTLDTKEREG